MLEVFVHVDDAEAFLAKAYVYRAVRVDEADVAVLEEGALPQGWNARPETLISQTIGDEFLERAEQAVLALPSVVVPPELRYDPLYMIYLLNPTHPKFDSLIEVRPSRPLAWDTRLAHSSA